MGEPAPPPPHVHSSTKVDLSNATRGIWLVKVPKYLAARWEKIPGNVEAGKLKIARSLPGQKPKVTLSLSESTLCLTEPGDKEIPKDHDLIVASLAHQTLGVFSLDEEGDRMFLEGSVAQKLECRPIADNRYMTLKRDEIRKASQPARQVKQLDRVVNNYRPVSDHKHNIEYDVKKKNEGKKARDEKEKVLEMLFGAFERHQYYNVKDLVKITNQPIGYLKEVLKEYCSYCVKNPHKNMWELKPEYRHYKPQETEDD